MATLVAGATGGMEKTWEMAETPNESQDGVEVGLDMVEERVCVFEPELCCAGCQDGVAAANGQDDIAMGLLFEEAALADPRQSAVQRHHLMREHVERRLGSRVAGVCWLDCHSLIHLEDLGSRDVFEKMLLEPGNKCVVRQPDPVR